MRTRLLPVLALALASTVGCTPTPPTFTSPQSQVDTQRQIAQADDDMEADDQSTQAAIDESKMPKPLSVQELPQRLEPSQVVELPEDKVRRVSDASETMDEARSTQQWRRGWRGYGYRGYGGRLRYYGYGGYYYPYYLYGNYYYPYAYYPYTYAYYPYSYYTYDYYPYAYYPYYLSYGYYYPYGYYSYGRRYGRYGRYWGRGWGGGRSFARGGRGGRR